MVGRGDCWHGPGWMICQSFGLFVVNGLMIEPEMNKWPILVLHSCLRCLGCLAWLRGSKKVGCRRFGGENNGEYGQYGLADFLQEILQPTCYHHLLSPLNGCCCKLGSIKFWLKIHAVGFWLPLGTQEDVFAMEGDLCRVFDESRPCRRNSAAPASSRLSAWGRSIRSGLATLDYFFGEFLALRSSLGFVHSGWRRNGSLPDSSLLWCPGTGWFHCRRCSCWLLSCMLPSTHGSGGCWIVLLSSTIHGRKGSHGFVQPTCLARNISNGRCRSSSGHVHNEMQFLSRVLPWWVAVVELCAASIDIQIPGEASRDRFFPCSPSPCSFPYSVQCSRGGKKGRLLSQLPGSRHGDHVGLMLEVCQYTL